VSKAFKYLARWLFIAAVASSLSFLGVHFGRRTEWYRNHVYTELLQGNEDQRLRAATILALVGGERQLLEGLKQPEPEVHSIAQRGLEHLWFTAAGNKAYKMVEDACAAAEREDFKEALRILDKLTADYPDFAEGWNRRGAVLWQSGQFAKSIADCERALKLNPNHYSALQGLGICHLQLGDVEEATDALRRALRIAPHDPTTQRSLRRCEEFLRSHRTARTPSRGTLL
jgi:tetratricopeptide (TPR) repeat protein